MRKLLSIFLLILSIATIAIGQEYVLQPDSEIKFKAKHMGILNVNGRFTEFSGSLILSDDGLKAEGQIMVASVDTNNKTRDKELKSVDFLDSEKYPEIIYRSIRSFTENEKSIIEGELTIKDQARTLAFPYELTKTGKGILIEFETTITRSEFNLEFDSMDGLVGDEVVLKGYLLFEYKK